MKIIFTNIAIFCIFFTVQNPLSATVHPIKLNDRIAKSAKVILAKVMNAESYWDTKHKNIYTSYTIEAKAHLKQNSPIKTFQLIIRGGEVADEMEIVTPNAQLTIGQEYLLIVKNANAHVLNPNVKNIQLKMPKYQLYAHVQGAIPYVNGKYVDYFDETYQDEKTILDIIQKITNHIATTPEGNIYDPQSEVVDADNDGVCFTLDCDDNDPNYPLPVGARCNDGNSATKNDQIQSDGCTCAGNPGLPVNCDNLAFTAEGTIIRIDNLTAKSEKIEFIGEETNGQPVLICAGDCKETQYIEGLTLGNKIIRVWMYGENDTVCYREVNIEIKAEVWNDEDNDEIVAIKDCDDNNPNIPTTSGSPCDDGDPSTLRDIILIDGCTCAGVPTCLPNQDTLLNKQTALVIKNGNGVINPIFYAGTTEPGYDLVIEGSGFGNVVGSIEFPNSGTGGRNLFKIDNPSDIVSWSESLIRVKVPTKAGSGVVMIKNSLGILLGSASINIGWSISSVYSIYKDFTQKTRQNVKLINRNQAGGYTIQLNSSSGFANSFAVPAIERAIDKWICANGVNWQLDKSGTTTGFGNDGNCVVLYDNLPLGILAITTSRYKASGNSSCNLQNTVWYLKEFDIQIAPNAALGGASWNFGLNPPAASQYDFETTLLHELGHAHGIAHLINEEDIMHYSVRVGQSKRIITQQAAEASAFKMSLSAQPNCISSHEPMTPLTPECINVIQKSTSARVKILLEGFYDATTDQLKTNLLEYGLLPPSQPFDSAPHYFSEAISVSGFPLDVVDWVLLELRDENDKSQVIRQKPVLLKKDGALTDFNGNDLITFEGLDDKNYYIAIFHKSHLPIVSNFAQPLNDNPTLFDFSSSALSTKGNGQQKEINGRFFMNSGDFDGNGIINNLDFNIWKNEGASLNSYSPADADGNGIINNLDFNLWKANGSKVSVLTQGQ